MALQAKLPLGAGDFIAANHIAKNEKWLLPAQNLLS